jgi:hypothetical protein
MLPREWLYYGFWSAVVLSGLVEGGLITYFLWRLLQK